MSNTNAPHNLSDLSLSQRMLLEKRLRGTSPIRAGERIMTRRPAPEEPAPLSFAQQRLWFLDQFEPNNSFYNIPVAVRLLGTFRIEVLERALSEIARRHEALRTTFASDDGSPFQVIAKPRSATLPLVDLRELPRPVREAQVQFLATEEAHRPFDLSRGPLARWWIIQLGGSDHVMLMTMHHIISDAWSLTLLIRELSTLYAAFSRQQPSPLAELPIQYADYAFWQQHNMGTDTLASELSYWKQQLAKIPAPLELPIDHPRPPTQTFHGAIQPFVLSTALTGEIKEVGRQEGATLFMTLLAAFSTLLCRLSGQEDILIGTPIAGRSGRIEFEQLIGLFVNTLVIRNDLSGEVTFRELLQRVRETTLEAFEHQNLPFEYLVQELQPERDLSRAPLFQVMFVLHNALQDELSLSGLKLRPVEAGRKTAKFDLTLTMIEGKEALAGSFEFNTDLFEAATIKRLSDHFQVLLREIVAAPGRKLSSLPLLTETERQQLLTEWNHPRPDDTHRLCVDELIEARVERNPHAVALEFEQQHLTYDQINRKANQLAHHLQALGAGPEVPVAICLNRSPEMVIGLLGILKAGGAYVPLDPNYGSERLAFVLRDVKAPVLVTQQLLLEKLPKFAGTIVCLDADAGAIRSRSGENPRIRATQENLAYVIYTSGSTGVPKGVKVPHGALSNLMLSMGERPGLTANDTLLAVTTLSFDIAALELFLPLIVGARLVVASREVASDGQRLLQKILECGATVMQATPTSWQLLVEAGWEGTACLKAWCGGDALKPYLVHRLLERCSQVWNLFGPTETTIWSTVAQIECKSDKVSIGRPIANTLIYILDPRLQPVPVGMVGELHIGGAGLARGYVNRPDLTAEKFIPDPFSDKSDARLYKTGDRARYWLDGRIEFLGRVDYQVKLRGHRIELTEIEAVLMQHPNVRQAVVIADEDRSGDKRLVAYLMAGPEVSTIGELRGYLKAKLPDYMLPAAFVTLDRLPLTENGKVDRRALPTATSVKPDLDETDQAPQTPIQEILADVWAQVLGIERLGPRDSFFDLGGHSLLATRIISRVREMFEVELPLRTLFEFPTVAGMAQAIEAATKLKKGLVMSPVEPISRHGDLPLSFAQEHRLRFEKWARDTGLPYKSFHVNCAVRLKGHLDLRAFKQSLDEIVRHQEVFRTTFHTVDDKHFQRVGPVQPSSISMVDFCELPESIREFEALRALKEGAKQPFNLSRESLLRGMLARLSENQHLLLLTVHHIVMDGWSLGILLNELATFYAALHKGSEPPVRQSNIQFADYAAWERQWLKDEVLETLLTFWKNHLRGIFPVPELELRIARPMPAVLSYRAATAQARVPADLLASLKDLARRKGVSLFMVLMAALNTLLHDYSGEDDIGLISPVANRNRAETEDMIGFLANLVVFRTNLSGNPTFSELLARTRTMALNVYAHQHMPFPMLLDKLEYWDQPRRPYVFFNLQTADTMRRLQPSGLNVTPINLDTPSDVAEPGIQLNIVEAADGLDMSLEYETDRFDAASIAGLLEDFLAWLRAVVVDPERRISERSHSPNA